MLLSISSFSQTTIKVIKDSTGTTMFAFDKDQLNKIVKDLKSLEHNKTLVNAYDNKIKLLKEQVKYLQESNTVLTNNNNSYIAIKIKSDAQLEIQRLTIEEYKKIIDSHKGIETTYQSEIEILKSKLGKRNRQIFQLLAIDVVILGIFVYLLAH